MSANALTAHGKASGLTPTPAPVLIVVLSVWIPRKLKMSECIDLTTPAGRAAWKALRKRGRSKYGNVRTPTDAGVADSRVEAVRWTELRLLESAGQISDLRFHPRYELAAGVIYEGDSSYTENGQRVCEDVKGFSTQAFKIKAKLFRNAYPEIELRIIKAGGRSA